MGATQGFKHLVFYDGTYGIIGTSSKLLLGVADPSEQGSSVNIDFLLKI